MGLHIMESSMGNLLARSDVARNDKVAAGQDLTQAKPRDLGRYPGSEAQAQDQGKAILSEGLAPVWLWVHGPLAPPCLLLACTMGPEQCRHA